MQRNVKNNNYTVLVILLSFISFVTTSFAQQSYVIPEKYQLKTIVIDAGHGGHDNGTSGNNYKEKDLALDYSLQLGKLIEAAYPEMNVLYTRKTDKFISLKDRAKFANQNNADLFISIHCNGGSTKATGTETFVLGLHRNEDNLKVAMRENTSILLEDDHNRHYGNFDPNSPEAYILFNLFQNSNLDQSLELAKFTEEEFKNEGRRSRGVKQAGFLVLRETTMPSILIETGFLTNSNDERYMASSQGKQKIANSIFDAVKKYKTHLDKEAARILEKKREEDAKKIADIAKAKEEQLRKDQSKWAWPAQSTTLNNTGEQYYIQLLVSKRYDKSSDVFKELDNIVMSRIDVIDSYKYFSGPYATKSEANSAHEVAQSLGFRDAYILTYKNGKLVR